MKRRILKQYSEARPELHAEMIHVFLCTAVNLLFCEVAGCRDPCVLAAQPIEPDSMKETRRMDHQKPIGANG
jgi:hypothetical protein